MKTTKGTVAQLKKMWKKCRLLKIAQPQKELKGSGSPTDDDRLYSAAQGPHRTTPEDTKVPLKHATRSREQPSQRKAEEAQEKASKIARAYEQLKMEVAAHMSMDQVK
ncbi:hypothetical protein NL676_009982 [Syzygium grande]|nr:hypothetical protein NL676_009982 [Syzygium grande]